MAYRLNPKCQELQHIEERRHLYQLALPSSSESLEIGMLRLPPPITPMPATPWQGSEMASCQSRLPPRSTESIPVSAWQATREAPTKRATSHKKRMPPSPTQEEAASQTPTQGDLCGRPKTLQSPRAAAPQWAAPWRGHTSPKESE